MLLNLANIKSNDDKTNNNSLKKLYCAVSVSGGVVCAVYFLPVSTLLSHDL